jgi:hypothetical protein
MLKNAFLMVFSIVLSVVLCEFGLRVYDRLLNWQYPGEEGDGSIFWQYDSLLGWKFEPNRSAYFTSKAMRFRTLVKINSKGLRDDEYAYTKKNGVKRILLLGDSVTAGLEVEKKDVIDSRLEHYLGGHGRYEVINAGVRAYGTDQSYLWLKHEGYKYNPDIVIYVFYENDPINNITIHTQSAKFGKSYFTLNDKNELVLNGVPVPKRFEPFDKFLTSDKEHQHIYDQGIEEKLVKWKAKTESLLWQFHLGRLVINALEPLQENWRIKSVLVKLKLSTIEKIRPEGPGPKEYRWGITKAIIRNMKTVCDDLGAKFLVYESTAGTAHPAYFSSTPLNRLSKELGLNYLESFEDFYKVSQGKEVFRFQRDIHWNAAGHDMAAKSLYEYLRRKAWI